MRINPLFSVIVLIVLVFTACDTKKKRSEETPVATEEPIKKYSYSFNQISEKVRDCPTGECTYVNVNYPVFDQTLGNTIAINQSVEQRVKTTLADFIREADGDEDIKILAGMFLKSYENFAESFPESQASWYVETEVMVSAATPQYVSLAFNTSSYTGGAHSNTLIEYVNLSPDGEELNDLDYFFESTEKLRELAENQFRKKYDLAPEEPLSQKGFIFDNDEFTLTENFGFTESAVIFYYNSYDIAPYAEGPTALLIPLINLRGIYKF